MAEVLAPFSRGRFHADWRVGLAAGYDRDGRQLAALDEAGFGFAELGTVGMIEGTDPLEDVRRLAKRLAEAAGSRGRMAVGVSLSAGTAREWPRRIVEEAWGPCVRLLLPHAQFITFNMTGDPGATLLEKSRRASLRALLGNAAAACPRTAARSLLFAKIPHRNAEAGERILEELIRAEFDGLVLAAECKGVRPVPEAETLRTVAAVARRMDGYLALVAVGGAADARGIQARLDCGADLVQVHRAFDSGGAAWLRRVREQCAAWSRREASRPETGAGSRAGHTPKELLPIRLPANAGPPSEE